MKSRHLPWIAFLPLAAFHIGQAVWYLPDLPARVAVHFDAAGRPNGWSSSAGVLAAAAVEIAIMAVIFGAPMHPVVGWVCYALAIVQFLIIGLVSSRDKALDVLKDFDQQIKLRRDELVDQYRDWGDSDDPPPPPMYRGRS